MDAAKTSRGVLTVIVVLVAVAACDDGGSGASMTTTSFGGAGGTTSNGGSGGRAGTGGGTPEASAKFWLWMDQSEEPGGKVPDAVFDDIRVRPLVRPLLDNDDAAAMSIATIDLIKKTVNRMMELNRPTEYSLYPQNIATPSWAPGQPTLLGHPDDRTPPGAMDSATPFTTAGRAATKVWATDYFQKVASGLEKDNYPKPSALHLDVEIHTGGSADWIALGLSDPRAMTDLVAYPQETFKSVWGPGFDYNFGKGLYHPDNQNLTAFYEGYHTRQLDFALLDSVVQPARAVWGEALPFSNYGLTCGTPSAPVPGQKPYYDVVDVPQLGADYQGVVMQPVCGYYWHQDGRGIDGGLTRAVKEFLGKAQLSDMTLPLSEVLRKVFKAHARKSVQQVRLAQKECDRPVLAWTAFPGMDVRFLAGPGQLGSFLDDPYAVALANAFPDDITDCAPPGEGAVDVCGSCIGKVIRGKCVSDGFQCVGYTVTVQDIAETVNTACKLGVRDFAFWGVDLAGFAEVMKFVPDCP